MKVDTEALEDRQIQLTVEVPEDRYNAAMRSAARRMSKRDKIPGFRPGKVPFEVAVGRFGEEAIFDEALDALGQEVYRQALEDSELEPFAPGTLNEVVSREPLVLRYSVPLAPEVELGKYRKLRVPFESAEVSDEAVDSMMEELRQRQALIEPADRPVEMGDVAVIDVEGNLSQPPEGESPLILKEEGISLLVEDDTDWPFPGIAAQLVGVGAGESIAAEHTFAEDYAGEELRGNTATFEIDCKEVKSRLVPEWTDALAQSLGEYEDLLDLRIKVRESLAESSEREAETAYADQVIGKVVEGASVDYPPLLVEQEVDDLIHDLSHRLESQGTNLEDYLRMEGKSADDIRADLLPRAEERVTRALVLGQVVEEEELEVEEQEIGERIDRLAQSVQDPEGNLRKALLTDQSKRRIGNDILFERAVARLVSIAKGENPDKGNPPAELEIAQPEPEKLETGVARLSDKD